MQNKIAMRSEKPMAALMMIEPTMARGTVTRGFFISSERCVAES